MPLTLVRLGDVSVIPLPAIHKTEKQGETALNFLIESEGKTLFYGVDGAWIHPDALPLLKESKPDVFILDCALGTMPLSDECVNHNNLSMIYSIIEILKASCAARDGAKFILSHVSTDKNSATHDELAEKVRADGIRVAYDGYFLGI